MHRFVTAALRTLLVVLSVWVPTAIAATETEKAAAIQKGLAYLYSTQQSGGSWTGSGNEQAATGAAVLAFLNEKDKWGDHEAEYQSAVDKAIAYLLSTATVVPVGPRRDGVNACFGGSDSCKGVYWFGTTQSTITTGMVAPAITTFGIQSGASTVATTSGPLAGMTWAEIAQAITNVLASSQSTAVSGPGRGGWSTAVPGSGDSNMSSTHWAVTALIYDELMGAVTPAVVKDDLAAWLANVQNASGAACSQPGSEQCSHADTGGWLLAMKYLGQDISNPQVQAALTFLNTQWQSTATKVFYGNFGHPYAMWAIYEGLETMVGLNDATHLTNVLTGCGARAGASGSGPCTWSEDYSQWLVKNQNDQGTWGGYSYWTDPVAAAFHISILGNTHIPLNDKQKSKSDDRTPVSQDRRNITPAGIQTAIAVPLAVSAQAAEGSVKPSKVRPPKKTKGVTALAINSDGSAIAGASTDKNIHIYDATTGQEAVTLKGSKGLPTGLALAPGGGTLNSVGRDSVVRIWDAVSGRELGELTGHEHAIRAVAASPDGNVFATAGEETRVMLWNQTGGKLNKILFGPTDFVNALSFSPDSRFLAIAGEDARVLIFDVATGKPVYTLLGHAAAIDTVAFSPDGTVLASGGQDSVVHLWDPVKGVQRQVLNGHQAPIRTIAFSSDGQLIASAGDDTQIILWNTATGTINKVLTGSTGAVNALIFDPTRPFLVSATESGEITIWNVIAGVKLRTITVPTGL